MAGNIVLVRHGPSSLVVNGRLSRDEYLNSRVAYDRAGIQSDSIPPDRIRQLARTGVMLVSSDLTRAVESMQHLAGERLASRSSLLREISLHVPSAPGRLPPNAWEALAHVNWFYEIARGRDLSQTDAIRVQDAANWLIELTQSTTVVAVTHGVVRRAIARRLNGLGWKTQRRDGGYRPWSAWYFNLA